MPLFSRSYFASFLLLTINHYCLFLIISIGVAQRNLGTIPDYWAKLIGRIKAKFTSSHLFFEGYRHFPPRVNEVEKYVF